MIRKHDIKNAQLPYEWNMTNMMKKEILSTSFGFTKVGWVYHFNGIPDKENGSVCEMDERNTITFGESMKIGVIGKGFVSACSIWVFT